MFYPVKGDPGDVCVSWVQSPGHDSVGVHQPVSQSFIHTGVNARPGDGGSIELEALRQQDRAGITNKSHPVCSRNSRVLRDFMDLFFTPT